MNLFILDVTKNWLFDAIRFILSVFDSIVYTAIQVLFRVIFNLANFELFGLYYLFESRIYLILGIFMLFKVTISLISYLVDPNKITDKQEGAGKLITRIMTSLIMLIMLPSFFNLATEFQNVLLPTIPKIIMGSNVKVGDTENVNRVSEKMALTLYQGFLHYKEDEGCDGDIINELIEQNNNINNGLSGEWSANALVNIIPNHINDRCNPITNSKIYKYDYLPLIPLVIGVVLCYVIFSLCISVAIRAFKLIILRMLAPIPIVSYIDPKSSKDGMFKTWTKTFGSTWLELFIYVGIIYFVTFIIDFILSGDMWKGFFSGIKDPLDGIFLLAFLIIGLFMFAKQVPKFIFDALGIKNTGGFVKMLGMGAAALGAGGTIAAATRARNDNNIANGDNPHRIRNFGASLFSGIGSLSSAGNAILSSDKPTLRTGFDAQGKYNASELNRISSGSTFGGRMASVGSSIFTGQSSAEKMQTRQKQLDSANKAFKEYKSTIESRFDGDDGFKFELDNGAEINWLNFTRTYEAAQTGDFDAMTALYKMTGYDMDEIREKYDKIHKDGYAAFAEKVKSGNGDSVAYGKLVELKDAVKGIKVSDYDKYGKLVPGSENSIDLSAAATGEYVKTKETLGDISGTLRDLVISDKYKAATADSKEVKKGS